MRSTKRLKNSMNYNFSTASLSRLMLFFLFVMPILLRRTEAAELQEKVLDSAWSKNATNSIQIPIPNHTLYALDISSLKMNCTSKGVGTSRGRKCEFNGQNYFFKYEPLNSNQKPHLRELYHSQLIRRNIGAITPVCEYVFHERFQIACPELNNFTRADALHSSTYDRQEFRHNLTKAMDETEIAKLVTAQFFVYDTMKLANWGIVNRKVALIDVDGSYYKEVSADAAAARTRNQPVLLEEYLQLAKEVLRFTQYPGGEPRKDHIGIALSLNNFIDMQALHIKMWDFPTDYVHPSIDMTKDLYHSLLAVYINANVRAHSAIFSNNKEASLPMDSINAYYANEIENIAAHLKNQTLSVNELKLLVERLKKPITFIDNENSIAPQFFFIAGLSIAATLVIAAAYAQKVFIRNKSERLSLPSRLSLFSNDISIENLADVIDTMEIRHTA